PEHLVSRLFVRMSLLECRNGLFNKTLHAYQFNFELLNRFQLSPLTQKRIAACQWPELALPFTLPRTAVVIADPTRTDCKQCLLCLLKMTFWNEVTKLVHFCTSDCASLIQIRLF